MALHFELVSPQKLVFSGEVDQVDVPGAEGDFGVLAGHAPLVTTLRPGILTVFTGGTAQKIVVLGGFAEVSSEGLDFGAMLAHGRRVGGPALRRMTFHQRALMLKAIGQALLERKEELYALSRATGATRRLDARHDRAARRPP